MTIQKKFKKKKNSKLSLCVSIFMPMSVYCLFLPLPAFSRLAGSWHTCYRNPCALHSCSFLPASRGWSLQSILLSSPVFCSLVLYLHLAHAHLGQSFPLVHQCMDGPQPFYANNVYFLFLFILLMILLSLLSSSLYLLTLIKAWLSCSLINVY